jgi:hypothetical protein
MNMIDAHKELKEKQLKGMIRMRNWYFSISSHKDDDIKWSHSSGGLWGVETKRIVHYLDNLIAIGRWMDSDREILNGMRDFYIMNKGVKYTRDLVNTID